MKKYLLALMSFFMGVSAKAADLFSPVANDQSMKLLDALFPGLTGSGGADALASSMMMFNSGILMLGGVLATYTLLAGTLGTAHDGEMLGKKFSSVWIPIRYSLGTALVLPVIGGGYSVMQWLVYWCISQSVGLADDVWGKFVSAQNLTNIAAVSIQSPDAKQLGYTTLNIEVCMAALASKQAEKASGSGDSMAIGDIQTGITKEDGITTKTYYFGDKNETTGLKKDSCGSVSFTKFAQPVQSSYGLTNFITSIGNTQKIIDAQEAQYAVLVASLTPIAAEIYKTHKAADPALVNKAINTYQSNVAKGAADLILQGDAFGDLSKNASQDGWATAGFWFVKLSNLMDLVNRSLAAVPTAVGPGVDTSNVLDYYADAVPGVIDTMSKGGANIVGFGMGNEDGGSNIGWINNFKKAFTNLDPTILIKKAFTSSLNFSIQDGEHPLLAMKRIGNTTLGIAGAGFVSIVGVIVVLGVMNTGLAITLAGIMFSICIPMGLIGITLSYILPMMPALIWIGILVGWFIHCFEAIMAASLWAVLHLHPNGDDLTGKGANGYSLLTGILFRPVLAVFGFIAALLTLQIFGQFINKTFADIFLVSQQDSGIFVWIIGLIVGPLLYCIFLWTTIKKLFEIMHIVSNEIMKWIGGSGQVMGDMAKAIGHGGDHSQIVAAGMNLGNTAGQNALGGIEKHLNKKNADAAATEKFRIPIGADGKEIKLSDAQSQVMNTVAGANKGNTQSEISTLSQFNKMQGSLSSVSPKMGEQFKESLADIAKNPANKDLTTSQLMNKAFEGTIRQNYGQGAVSAMNNYAQGNPVKFQEALNQYETARQGASADLGTQGSKQALMQASSAINSAFQANAKKPVNEQFSPQEIFSTHLSRFNDSFEMAIPSVQETPSVDEPKIETPTVETQDVEPEQETPSVDEPKIETPNVEPQQVAQTPQISTENQTSDNQFKE